MTGRVGLHGGGEYLRGDEPFLRALLEAAAPMDHDRIFVVIVPTAAGRGRPDVAATTGRLGFERAAALLDRRVDVSVASAVDATSAADPAVAERIAQADLIHLPGGDPDLVPGVLRGSAAWRAIVAAVARGAVVAGASAGAMGLAEWAWTPVGGVEGLGLVRGLLVVPHYAPDRAARWRDQFGSLVPPMLGILGLAERTGIISAPGGRGPWRVAGTGIVAWYPPGSTTPTIARPGDDIDFGRPVRLDL